MTEIKIMLLDDDKTAIDNYELVIKSFNRANTDYNYKSFIATTLDQAHEYIKYNRLDAAIIDLNLGSAADDDDGNKAIEEIIVNFRMPIVIVSGELSKLNVEFQENGLVEAYVRGGEVSTIEILNKIKNKLSSLTIQYFSRNGYLEQQINDFYWNHLSKTINDWGEVAIETGKEIDKILSRHTVSCLNEKLYVNGNVGSFDKYHSGEMYIIPPIKKHYHTGDIIEKDSKKYIILNPACDIVIKGSLEFYVLAQLIRLRDLKDFQTIPKKEVNGVDKVFFDTTLADINFFDSLTTSGKDKFAQFKTNSKGSNYHYLPKFSDIETDYVIDFQNITTVDTVFSDTDYIASRESNISTYRKIASISSPFLKDIIVRFSTYYARQGQPNLL